MVDKRITFENAHPSKGDDVVLCHFCGETLHSPEVDIDWNDTIDHTCKQMLEAEVEYLNSQLKVLRGEEDATNDITSFRYSLQHLIDSASKALDQSREVFTSADNEMNRQNWFDIHQDLWSWLISRVDLNSSDLHHGGSAAVLENFKLAINELVAGAFHEAARLIRKEMNNLLDGTDEVSDRHYLSKLADEIVALDTTKSVRDQPTAAKLAYFKGVADSISTLDACPDSHWGPWCQNLLRVTANEYVDDNEIRLGALALMRALDRAQIDSSVLKLFYNGEPRAALVKLVKDTK